MEKTEREKLVERLNRIEAAVDAQIENGQSYGISGSHNKTNVNITELNKMANRIRRQIAIIDGVRTLMKPDFR